jgi:hypothetical protein
VIVDTWIVIVDDRVSGADAYPFSSEEQAVAAAYGIAPGDAMFSELTEELRAGGWVLHLAYANESDSIQVVRRPLDGGTPLWDSPFGQEK